MKKKVRVEVTWEDATSLDPWTEMDEARDLETAKCTTIGYLIFKDNERVVIASNVSEDDEAFGITCIPRGCITKIKKLKD